MRDPKKYTRSLIVCQSTVTITYIVIGIVVYYFLRLICSFTSSGICWCDYEEDLLWPSTTWTFSHRDHRLTSKCFVCTQRTIGTDPL
jgi:hypothetical protein